MFAQEPNSWAVDIPSQSDEELIRLLAAVCDVLVNQGSWLQGARLLAAEKKLVLTTKMPYFFFKDRNGVVLHPAAKDADRKVISIGLIELLNTPAATSDEIVKKLPTMSVLEQFVILCSLIERIQS